ncbi:hypothetical protein CBM2634_B170361 [Cupriavidus taiwanensis]|uniref:Uncharacterized protein n=1 Tax=Cupriavidus taiwanensis TaxID=164546 RepID=A0A375J796_9BURK|nr:hypothetical protein CBM2634_B170361 [Cupriavidus taiwanensis]
MLGRRAAQGFDQGQVRAAMAYHDVTEPALARQAMPAMRRCPHIRAPKPGFLDLAQVDQPVARGKSLPTPA